MYDLRVPGSLTAVQAARLAFSWVARNIAYDAEQYFNMTSMYGVRKTPNDTIRERRGICYQYADLYKALVDILAPELECLVVSGHGGPWERSATDRPFVAERKSNHAWNVVKVGNKYAIVESTWGAGHLSGRVFERAFTRRLNRV